MVGEEISSIIAAQRDLEARYESLLKQRNSLKALSNKTRYKENQKEIEEVARELRHSTKALCRNLKENPNVAENLLRIQTERSSLQATLSKTLRELKDQHFRTVRSMVLEHHLREATLAETTKREKEASAAVKRLARELQEEHTNRSREAAKSSEEIATLKEELADIKARAMVESRYMRREAEAKHKASRRQFQSSEKTVSADLQHLDHEMAAEKRVNSEVTSYLSRKQELLRQDIQGWIEVYDRDTEAMDKKLETLKTNRSNDLNRLADLTEKFRQCEEFVLAERKYQAIMKENEEEEKREHAAALLIQAVWRGHAMRVLLEKKRKRKGRKKRSQSKSPTRRRV
eukprot:TRINITY_DN42799_c0_g1_i1.p1 TRINITY_DN42799_c0_g1~~TRINITY_DN42799_c0_g1_i1.p1  ORF type:complete len:377 (-),score=88.43 TRINITY_DN42799_c0_g1_i1:9-1043(-)